MRLPRPSLASAYTTSRCKRRPIVIGMRISSASSRGNSGGRLCESLLPVGWDPPGWLLLARSSTSPPASGRRRLDGRRNGDAHRTHGYRWISREYGRSRWRRTQLPAIQPVAAADAARRLPIRDLISAVRFGTRAGTRSRSRWRNEMALSVDGCRVAAGEDLVPSASARVEVQTEHCQHEQNGCDHDPAGPIETKPRRRNRGKRLSHGHLPY